ncbi:probable tRNA threonylcarbamoyladenosine biosynthesis protein Gcp [Clostridium sp. CAG:575]|nr:probable tRNA threonylcarbamoyladenosine biosynthesis protein Gcp [Clostridium sp. CAG:575]
MEKDILTLGIESSCDETSVAVVKNGREILSNVIDTQIPIHEKYGGVVPEIASRNHIEAISRVTQKALKDANVTFDDIEAITPTYGPGLVGALLVGLSYAKALSFAIDKPLVGVNHIQGHIAANYITYKELKPPFLCVMMSGGNTQLVYVKNYTEFEVLGKTRDDAIGEAFDKVARVVGLGYPGGPKIDKLAKDGNPNSIELPKTHFENLDFSFSGIKTAVINLHHKTPDINKADLCASFEKTVTEILMENTKKALKQINVSTVALAGGVSANSYIRNEFLKLQDIGIKVYMPDLKLCTDNAAMIASAGYYNFIEGNRSSLDLNAIPNLKLQKN